MGKNQHIRFPYEGCRQVNQKENVRTCTPKEAIDLAREIAKQKVPVIIICDTNKK